MRTFEVILPTEKMIRVRTFDDNEFDVIASEGASILFDLVNEDGVYFFGDCEDKNGNTTYFIRFLNREDRRVTFYSLDLKDFYDLVSLYMANQYNSDIPLDYLHHCLYHIVEEISEYEVV